MECKPLILGRFIFDCVVASRNPGIGLRARSRYDLFDSVANLFMPRQTFPRFSWLFPSVPPSRCPPSAVPSRRPAANRLQITPADLCCFGMYTEQVRRLWEFQASQHSRLREDARV